MLNEERIRLMTRTAVLEEKNKTAIRANGYYRKEYVVSHFLVVWIWLTISFCILGGGVAFLYIEEFPKEAQNADWRVILYTALILYVMLVFAFAVVSLLVYSYRYSKYQETVKQLNANYKTLERMYKKEAMQLPAGKPAKEPKKAKRKVFTEPKNNEQTEDEEKKGGEEN